MSTPPAIARTTPKQRNGYVEAHKAESVWAGDGAAASFFLSSQAPPPLSSVAGAEASEAEPARAAA